ncbi:hypothetical protein ABPG72_016531 [Tetrahymena utriculariae]
MIVEYSVDQSDSKHQLSDEEKWLIVVSYKYFGFSQAEIVKDFGFAQSTVSRILKRYNQTGGVSNQYENCGRTPMKEQHPEVSSLIKEQLVENRTISTRQIAYQLQEQHNIDISHVTVCSIMDDEGFDYKRTKQIHLLTTENKLERMKYITKQMASPKLKFYVFSDESIFQVDKFNSFTWCNGDDITNIYERKQNSYANRQCHVWAAISLMGKTDLFVHTTKVDSNAYMNCIENCLLPFRNKAIPKRNACYLVQDGAPSHKAQNTMGYFEEQRIKVIQLPPWSPDLNPIELIWNIMKIEFKKRVTKDIFQTKQEIQSCLQEIWETITQEQIENCINSVIQNLPHILNKNGEYLQ